MRDVAARTVISQYSTSPTLRALIDDFNTWIDPEADFDRFYANVWDIDTAVGPGLDTWGRIVGVSRVLAVPVGQQFFGFQDQAGTTDVTGFSQGPFVNSTNLTSNFSLSDDAFRQLILIKAAANICATTPASLNFLLRQLFPNRGKAYVTDGGDMSMAYVFEFYLTPAEITVLKLSGLLPGSSGVQVNFRQILTNVTFGFSEAFTGSSAAPVYDFAGFGTGTFYPNNGLAVIA